MAPSCTQLAKGPPSESAESDLRPAELGITVLAESQSWPSESQSWRPRVASQRRGCQCRDRPTPGTRPADAHRTPSPRPDSQVRTAEASSWVIRRLPPGSSSVGRSCASSCAALQAGSLHRFAVSCAPQACGCGPGFPATGLAVRGWYRTRQAQGCSEACLYCEKFTEPANTPREHLCFFFKPIQGLDPHFPIFVAGLFLPAFSSVQVIQVR